MTFKQLKERKAELFGKMIQDKYDGVDTPSEVVKEYRFLQREEKRMVKAYKESKVA